MRILVFGAGVLGCNLANDLYRAGKDTSLLTRGAWAEEIQKNGLRIKNKLSPRMSVSRISVEEYEAVSAFAMDDDSVALITEKNGGYVLKFKTMELIGKLKEYFGW